METTLTLLIKMTPESMASGYILYMSEDIPDFSVLCGPEENAILDIISAVASFMPYNVVSAMKDKIPLRGIRIISDGKSLFRSIPSQILIEVDLGPLPG